MFNKIFTELVEDYEECKEDNWDGYNADKITRKCFIKSLEVLFSLISNPSYNEKLFFKFFDGVAPDCNGFLDIDFIKDSNNYLSVSIFENKIHLNPTIKGEYKKYTKENITLKELNLHFYKYLNLLIKGE